MRSTICRRPLATVCFGIALAVGSTAFAQEADGRSSLTVEVAVARALEREPVDRIVEARAARARAEQQAGAAFENPELEYEHERLLGDGGEAEHGIALAKTFEISGGRGIRRSAGDHHRRAVAAENAAWLADLEASVRLAFYRVLHAQQRVEAIRVWTARLERAVEDVAARSAAGDASAYDALRFRRELGRARAELGRDEAARDRLWAELAAWTGGDPAPDRSWPRVKGELAPTAPTPGPRQLRGAPERSPEIEALDARAAEAGELARAAGRAWVPELTLSAGYKTAAAGTERAHGFVVGVGAPLPLLNRGRGEQAAAAAEQRELLAERELTATVLIAELEGLAVEAAGLQRLVREQRPGESEAATRLLGAAEAAYRGGELGAMELVDAYGSHLEGTLQLLEIELEAREARIGLERLLKGLNR